MSNTLVIKGADFETNRLAVVSFESIPCTAISLDESSYSITDNDPVEIGYTVTPSNTTDAVIWSSSDENVVTVNNGIMTIVGSGTATITVTCGTNSDTASVSVTLQQFADPQWEWATFSGSAQSVCSTYSTSTSNKYISSFGKNAQATEHEIATTNNNVGSPYAIKIPSSTKSIKIDATTKTGFYNGTSSRIVWSHDVASGASGNTDKIAFVQYDEINSNNLPITKNVPEGADSFGVTLRFNDAQVADSANALAETYGITIEFLQTTVS